MKIFTIAVLFQSIYYLSWAEGEIEELSSHKPLQNLIFNCCVKVESPYVERDEALNPPLKGWSFDIFKQLKENTGFECNYKIYNVSYSFMAGYMRDCVGDQCGCDIVIGSWWNTKNRSGTIFLPPHGLDSLVVVTRRENVKQIKDVQFFISAFTIELWLSIFAMFVIFIILKIMDKRFAPLPKLKEGNNKELSLKNWRKKLTYFLLKTRVLYRIRKAIQDIAALIRIGPPITIPGEGKSTRQWFLNFTVVIFGVIITLIYEAAITTQMVKNKLESKFRTSEDLINCNIPPKEVCFHGGDAIEEYWNISVLPFHNSTECTSEASIEKEEQDVYLKLLNDSEACEYLITSEGYAEEVVNSRYGDKLEITGEPIFVLGLHFLHSSQLNISVINALHEQSLQMTYNSQIMELKQYLMNRYPIDRSRDSKIRLKDLIMFFIIAIIFIAVLALYMFSVGDS